MGVEKMEGVVVAIVETAVADVYQPFSFLGQTEYYLYLFEVRAFRFVAWMVLAILHSHTAG